MADTYLVKLLQIPRRDPRLGRHINHDARSLRYQPPRKAKRTLKSQRHQIAIPILDQGNVGSCTGYSGASNMGWTRHWQVTEPVLKADPGTFALRLYSDATKVDPWPGSYEPDDTGSDGLSVAKVLKDRGLIAGYQHATSLEAALAALADGPVMIGSAWHSDMFEPSSEGEIIITGPVEGGHEYTLDELDVEHQRAWIRQSWGASWGLQGRAWLSFANLGALLEDDGDCTILVPRTDPAPQPSEPPTPAPLIAEEKLIPALAKFTKTKGCPKYVGDPARAWLKTKS